MQRRIQHNGSPVLEWAFSNIVVDTDADGHRKFTKGKARQRIDPMVVLTMAAGIAAEQENRFVHDSDWLFELESSVGDDESCSTP